MNRTIGRPMKEYNIIHRVLSTLSYVDTEPYDCNCSFNGNSHDIRQCLVMDFIQSFYEYHPNSTPGGPHTCDDECKTV